ncbi:MAG TPA: MFS transporter [Candidatus Acidoferrales bacterium]|nr:MFS transporter [Candidatus Acidoferrales bacterium]
MPEPLSSEAKPAVHEAAAPLPSLRYAWYVVGVLSLLYVFSFVDRQIFSLIVGPLRRDLQIGDTQVSLLMGFSFALFYTFFGIPIGHLSDVYSRRWIIAIGLVLWSGFTVSCGLAHTYAVMLVLRMGVGVGEAALSPAAYSLITDYFEGKRLATALSVYSMGIYVGSGLSYLLGGLVVRFASAKEMWTLPLAGMIHPWQLIFFVVGLPGIALAPLLCTVREPGVRRLKTSRPEPRLRNVLSYLWENRRTVLLHNTGFGLLALSSYAAGGWVPEFYRRRFHWEIGTVGIVYGSIVAVMGCIGLIVAGRIADRMRARGRANSTLFLGVLIAVAAIPVNCLLYLAPSAAWATFWLVPAAALAAAPFGIAPAAIQQMMPAAMRGKAAAVYLFIVNLVGLGIGPTAVGAATQYLFRSEDAVQYSLVLVTSIACALAATLLYGALNPFLMSLDRLRVWSAQRA